MTADERWKHRSHNGASVLQRARRILEELLDAQIGII